MSSPWSPAVHERLRGIVRRHGLDGRRPRGGFNPTHPTFVCGDAVVKLFDEEASWRAERAALRVVATDPSILAPRIVAEGERYLVTTVVPGRPGPPTRRLAGQLGEQVRRIHALRPSVDVPRGEFAVGALRCSLPPHLEAQAADYVAGLEPASEVFVHGDLCGMHAFVDGGELTGIIDWGDAIVADPHYELIQVYRDALGCDKELLAVFLEASGWTVRDDFPRRALGFAILRQATGLVQHRTMDVFEPFAGRLGEFATLDELAADRFDVSRA